MNDTKPVTNAELIARDKLLAAADAIVQAAGYHWNADREHYMALKLEIIEAADEYHAAMRDAEGER